MRYRSDLNPRSCVLVGRGAGEIQSKNNIEPTGVQCLRAHTHTTETHMYLTHTHTQTNTSIMLVPYLRQPQVEAGGVREALGQHAQHGMRDHIRIQQYTQ